MVDYGKCQEQNNFWEMVQQCGSKAAGYVIWKNHILANIFN